MQISVPSTRLHGVVLEKFPDLISLFLKLSEALKKIPTDVYPQF